MRATPALLLFLALAGLFSSALADPPADPTGVVAYAPNQSSVHLSWIDNASNETAYYVDRWNGSQWVVAGNLNANFQVFRDGPFPTEEQIVKYRVAAVNGDGQSNWVDAEVEKPEGDMNLALDYGYPEGSGGRAGQPVSIQIQVANNLPTRYLASDLPPGNWLTLDENTGVLSGTPPAPGIYRFFVGVEFGDSKKFEQVHFLRVLPDSSIPEVRAPSFRLPPQHLGVNGGLDISGLFRDPVRPKGAWFVTPAGPVIVALFDGATPRTVDNFLGYVNRGDYDGCYLSRADFGFVIQGGGARPASATAPPTQWQIVPKRPSPPNEAGISNTRGTIAMAKMGGNPDTATTEWFFSVGFNNPAILDPQNGGFTAFGEVVGAAGMNAVDILNSLPTANYEGLITGTSGTLLNSVPVIVPEGDPVPLTPTANSLVRFSGIYQAPPVVITLVSNSNPTILDAGVSGMVLFLKSKNRIGTTNLQLRATNLDGNSVDFVLPVRIDDLIGPGFRLTSIRGVNPPGTLFVKGRATDTIDLGSWRYRINKKGWRSGGRLSGKSASFSKKMRGFRRGKNLIEIEVFDARKNSSGVLKQTLTFS